jgi:hypothetical protein
MWWRYLFERRMPTDIVNGLARSETGYKACARGQRSVGSNGGTIFEGMVNVESMAGALLGQLYRTDSFRQTTRSFTLPRAETTSCM